jgi:SPP1 family predicted phage head-tail adaptor
MTCSPCKTQRKLRNRITVEQVKESPTVDGNDEVNLTLDANWETYITRDCAFESLSGTERFASEAIQAGQTHRIWLRSDSYSRAITTRMRVQFEGRKFNILAAVDKNEERLWVRLDVAEAK